VTGGGERSGNQTEFFADLHGLGAALGAELVKKTAGMGLDRVFAYKESGSDFAIAKALRDQLQDLEFAARDSQVVELGFVEREGVAATVSSPP
jgi:hypothetical protein